MRQKATFLICISILLFGAAGLSGQEFRVGQIRISKPVGSVIAVHRETGESRTLARGDILEQGWNIETGANSSVVLVFSNGSTVAMEASTSLTVDNFLLEPFEGDPREMEEEPSTSIARMSLDYGEVFANVKRRKDDSEFEIRTPVGAAGVRGTSFRMRLEVYDGSVQFILFISTYSGLVNFNSFIPQIPSQDVPQGTSFSGQATITDDGDISADSSSSDQTEEEREEMEERERESNEATEEDPPPPPTEEVQEAPPPPEDPPPPSPATTRRPPSPGDESQTLLDEPPDEIPADDPPSPQPPPPPAAEPPRTTPVEGR